MKKISVIAIVVALVAGLASISCAASDRAIEKQVINFALESIKRTDGVNDINKRDIGVIINVHNMRGEKHWIAADVSLNSKKYGKCAVAVYLVMLDTGSSLKITDYISVSAAIDYNEGVKQYRDHLAKAKALAEHYGDSSSFILLTLN